jgi:RimJ/RimL family protein N-acetyltransferase
MRLETERLVLRPMELGDAAALFAMHATPEVSRFMTSLDPEQTRRWLEQDRRDWAEQGYGMLAILERETSRFLGRTGLKHWPQFDEVEVGWALAPEFWGQGFAAEAGRACVDWGFENLDVPYLTAMIRPENHRSIRVAERLEMTPLRSDVLLGAPVTVYVAMRSGER